VTKLSSSTPSGRLPEALTGDARIRQSLTTLYQSSLAAGDIGTGRLVMALMSPSITPAERQAAALVERLRPPSLRQFDQIPMRSSDLLRQVKLMASYLAGKSVAFVGDSDSTSLLLGLLSQLGSPRPAHMLVVDFDERLLTVLRTQAQQYGFGDILEVRRYNVFDPIPADLLGKYDWYYCNPPYGSRNDGASARLFITRGCELTKPHNGRGCIILPDDSYRAWARRAMITTQQFLSWHGWTIREKLEQMHQYHLDDDKELASSMLLVEYSAYGDGSALPMRYEGRRVEFSEIAYFYGRNVLPPYPRYIRADGTFDQDWQLRDEEQ
jgi:N4-bis(aminopropyl)spermidine synthase